MPWHKCKQRPAALLVSSMQATSYTLLPLPLLPQPTSAAQGAGLSRKLCMAATQGCNATGSCEGGGAVKGAHRLVGRWSRASPRWLRRCCQQAARRAQRRGAPPLPPLACRPRCEEHLTPKYGLSRSICSLNVPDLYNHAQ